MTANLGKNPPRASRKPHEMSIHGHVRTDPYYWLRERDNPEVLDYLNAENAYLEEVLSPLQELRNELFEEMKGRIKEEDESVPYREGNYLYYSKFVAGGEYPLYCRKRTDGGEEEVLLDGNAMAEGLSYFHIGGMEVSDDENMLMFAVDTVGRRNYTLRIKNLATGEYLADEIPETEGGNYAWASDNSTVYYVRKDQETLLGNRVFRHTLGTPVAADELVYVEKNNQYYMGLYRMKSKKYIAIVSEHIGVATEVQLLLASDPKAQPRTFLQRGDRHEYAVEHYEDRFYVRTNRNGAHNFQLMEVEEALAGDPAQWRIVLPHREDVLLEGIEVFRYFMVVQERKEGLVQLRIIDQRTGDEHYLDFGEQAYSAGIGTNPEFDTVQLRFGYTSLTTPRSVFDYNMEDRTKVLLKEQAVLGGFDKQNYASERIFVVARDGARIPVSLVYRKDTPLDGTAPLLQYAYGSYGATIDAAFSPSRLSLLDRGFVFAIAHIRGGMEMGRQWYESGRMFQKKNTFNDFIDCSRALVQQKYAAADKLFAMGGSAGGLLMGAVINEAPELYKGVVAAVPFVDVVTTMLDETIPLTTGEFEEWGNPQNEEAYRYMLSYSPYDNVRAMHYPHLLVTTGLHDSQVQYWEPAKWVAKLRDMKLDDRLLLLHTDMSAGHGGASGRFTALKTTALEYAFLLDLAK